MFCILALLCLFGSCLAANETDYGFTCDLENLARYSVDAGDKTTFGYNDEVEITGCASGYALFGNSTPVTAKCVFQDYWQQRPHYMSCIKKVRSCSGKPRDANMILTPSADSYETGEKFNISCEDGYDLVTRYRKSKRTVVETICYNGRSSANYYFCEKNNTCSKSSINAYGPSKVILTPDKDTYAPGEEINATCPDGYVMYLPGKPKDLNISANPTVEVTCTTSKYKWPRGYTIGMAGQRWPYPVGCVPKGCSLGYLGYGSDVTPKKTLYSVGEEVTYDCPKGYEPPTVTFTCHKYRETYYGFKASTYCKRAGCSYSYGYFKYNHIAPPDGTKTQFALNSTVPLKCTDGYKLNSRYSDEMKCVLSRWGYPHWLDSNGKYLYRTCIKAA